jgi:hypothetical protein
VLGEKNKPQQQRQAMVADVAVMAKMAGTVTPERVKQALAAYIEKQSQYFRSQACLDLPMQGEADESTVGMGYTGIAGQGMPPATFTFYNLMERRDFALVNTLRGYGLLRRLESLGLARQDLVAVSEWQGRLASGGVRFELTEAAMGRVNRSNPRCFQAGVMVPEAVIQVQQFTEQQPRPRFIVRSKLQVDEAAKPVVEKFGHFQRMVEPGGVMQGTLRYQDGQLQVENLQLMNPRFFPDTSQLRLPIVEAPPPSRSNAIASNVPGQKLPPVPIRETVWQQVMGMSTLSNGGLTMTYCCAGASTPAASSVPQAVGKWYAEVTLRTRRGRPAPDSWTNVLVMATPRDRTEMMMAATQAGALGRGDRNRYRDGDVFGVALDADGGRVWYSLNGDWMNGTPGVSGGQPLVRGVPQVLVATSSASSDAADGMKDSWTANFGRSKFRSAIPRGFRSWDGRQQ